MLKLCWGSNRLLRASDEGRLLRGLDDELRQDYMRQSSRLAHPDGGGGPVAAVSSDRQRIVPLEQLGWE